MAEENNINGEITMEEMKKIWDDLRDFFQMFKESPRGQKRL